MRLHLLLLSALFSCAALASPPPLPHAATSFGAAVEHGWVYIYGGNTGKAHEFHRDCINGDLFRWQAPGGEQWQALSGSTPLLGAPLAAWQGGIFRVGGMQAHNAKGEANDLRSVAAILRYDPARGAWEDFASLPEPRSSHDVAVIDHTLYVGGGWRLGGDQKDPKPNEGTWASTLLHLDLQKPETGWASAPQPFQRRALAMVAIGQRIWCLGGMDELDQPSTAVDWYEPATSTWGKGPALPDGPMRGFGMAACTMNGRLIASPVTGKIYVLSADGGKWEEIGAMQKARFFHRILNLGDGSALVVGGSGRDGHVLEPEIFPLAERLSAPAPASQNTVSLTP